MKDKNIELRSEKVRSVIGKVPPPLLRVGVTIITIVIIVIIALTYYIPYPQTENLDIVVEKIKEEYYAYGKTLVKDAKYIKVGQKANVLLLSINGDYSLSGRVYSISESKGEAYIKIKITPTDDISHLRTLPSGRVTVYISNSSILKRVIHYVKKNKNKTNLATSTTFNIY